MSPLVCSLFALAALHAAADAQSNCNTKIYGHKTDRTAEGRTFNLPAGGGFFYNGDACPSKYLGVGVNATACNNDKDGEAPLFVEKRGDYRKYVRCPDGCLQGAQVKTMFYCEYMA